MIDSHAHVNFNAFDLDRDEVITRARAAGLTGWIEVGTNLKDSYESLNLAKRNEGVFASAGLHPSDISNLKIRDLPEFKKMLNEDKIKAVGEVGLDFYRGGVLSEQILVLKKFIALANDFELPVIFHVRSGKDIDAHEELIRLLRSYSGTGMPRGVVHTYSGTNSQAEEYLDMGLHLSISGVVTFKNAGDMAIVASNAPLERLLIETDCPFLAPQPFRGQRNEPSYVGLVADKIAELRNITTEEVRNTTFQNTETLFGLRT